MKTVKLIAVDLDGPLLTDTFSPLIRQFCLNYGVEYSRDIERNTFSRKRSDIAAYWREKFRDQMSAEEKAKTDEEMMATYFRIRAEYLQEHPIAVREGVPGFLERMARHDVRLVCYGGLAEDYMRRELGEYAEYFERYICTNEFRPGVREIVCDIYSVRPEQALFIDDVAFVAEHAKALGASFIGIPSAEPWSWQRDDMAALGVPFQFASLGEVTDEVLAVVDERAAAGRAWAERS